MLANTLFIVQTVTLLPLLTVFQDWERTDRVLGELWGRRVVEDWAAAPLCVMDHGSVQVSGTLCNHAVRLHTSLACWPHRAKNRGRLSLSQKWNNEMKSLHEKQKLAMFVRTVHTLCVCVSKAKKRRKWHFSVIIYHFKRSRKCFMYWSFWSNFLT